MTPRAKGRWFSLSLRSLLLGITLLSVALGWYQYHVERWRELKRWSEVFGYNGIRWTTRVVGSAEDDDRWNYWPSPWMQLITTPRVVMFAGEADRRDELPANFVRAASQCDELEMCGEAFDGDLLKASLHRSLNSLRLYSTSVSDTGFQRVLGCPNLKTLHVISPNLTRLVLENLPAWPDLEQLHINVRLGELADYRPSEPSNVKHVQILLQSDMYSASKDLPGDQPLAWLSVFAAANHLTIYGEGPIDDELLRQICRRCANLRILHVSHGTFSVAGMEEVGRLRDLESLLLVRCGIEPKAITVLHDCRSLRWLLAYPIPEVDEPIVYELYATGVSKIDYSLGEPTIFRSLRHKPPKSAP